MSKDDPEPIHRLRARLADQSGLPETAHLLDEMFALMAVAWEYGIQTPKMDAHFKDLCAKLPAGGNRLRPDQRVHRGALVGAVRWLVERGMDREAARRLVADAAQEDRSALAKWDRAAKRTPPVTVSGPRADGVTDFAQRAVEFFDRNYQPDNNQMTSAEYIWGFLTRAF